MVWYKDLYVGKLIGSRKDDIISGIERGSYPFGVCLLVIPENPSLELEIISASDLKFDYVREHCGLIVGLSMGSTEGKSLVVNMVQDVMAARNDADIRAWLSSEH